MFLFTNGDLLNREILEDLFDAGLQKLSISVYDKTAWDEMQQYVRCFGPNRVGLTPVFEWNLGTEFHNYGGNIGGNGVKQQPAVDRGCMLPFRKAVVTADGFLSLCCLDCYSDVVFDNVMDRSLHDIFIGNEKLVAIRRKLETTRKGLPLCEKCSYGGDDYTVFQ